jgi:hypothetical protein
MDDDDYQVKPMDDDDYQVKSIDMTTNIINAVLLIYKLRAT